MSHIIKLLLTLSIICTCLSLGHAETPPSPAWIAQYNGPANGGDVPKDIAVDSSGNMYVTGESQGNGTGIDYFTIKYDSNGNELWGGRYNGPGNSSDRPRGIAVDSSGNVYVTGESYGGSTLYDCATIKYDTNGNQLWVARYNSSLGNYNDRASNIALDGSGNVYVTGRSKGTTAGDDYVTIKYNGTDGSQLWVARYDGPAGNDDQAKDITIDSNGNAYITGISTGIFSSYSSYDYATVKYNTNGSQLWAARYNYPYNRYDNKDFAYAIAVDGSGNVYVTGGSESNGVNTDDYATIKYDTNGNELWVARYANPTGQRDIAYDMVLDSNGDVYVTGWSYEIGGAGYVTTTIKYDSTNGSQLWLDKFDGNTGISNEDFYNIALDGMDNVYVATPSLLSSYDFTLIKYDSTNGSQTWVVTYNSADDRSEMPTALAVDSSGNAHIAGYKATGVTSDDYLIVKYGTTNPPGNNAPVLDPIGNKTVTEGELLSFTISATDPDGDPLTYSASNLPSGASFNPSTQTFSWTPSTGQAGTYTGVHFEVTDGTDTDSEDITITVNPPGESMSLLEIALNATNSLISSQSSSSIASAQDDISIQPGTVKAKAEQPVDFLRKAATSFREAIDLLEQNDLENVYIRIGKAIWDLKKTCGANIPAGDVIRIVVETPTVLECTSDSIITSDGIKAALLETAYDNAVALMSSPDPLWDTGALNALGRAAWNMEIATYRLAQGKVDETFVYLGRAMRYFQEANAYGVPANSTAQLVKDKYTTTYDCSVYNCY